MKDSKGSTSENYSQKHLSLLPTKVAAAPTQIPFFNRQPLQKEQLTSKKVKCTLVQTLRLCRGRTAHRGSRGIALLSHDQGTRRGRGVSVTPRPFFTSGKDPVLIVQEVGWAPGLVWTGTENLDPPGFDPRAVQPVASRYTD
jgi:hypothetical protein